MRGHPRDGKNGHAELSVKGNIALLWANNGLELLGYLLHANAVGMSALLVDIAKLDVFHAVVVTDGLGALGDFVGKTIVDDEIDGHSGIAFLRMLKQVSKGWTVVEEIVAPQVVVFVFADGCPGPTVVGTTENEDNVGAAEVVAAGDERTR